jgi:hypothetical protein
LKEEQDRLIELNRLLEKDQKKQGEIIDKIEQENEYFKQQNQF